MDRQLLALRNRRGFTLIEVLVALVIMACGLLASLVGIMTAIDHSLMNEMRNEATKVAQEQSEMARNVSYANLTASQQTVSRQIRKQLTPFLVTVSVQSGGISPNGVKMVTTTVNWNFKNLPQKKLVLGTVVRETR